MVSWLKRWFTEGNVPVKVGVIVLFLGVAALLKYAADQGWLHVRMEFRLAGIAAAALGGLVFAWRKRDSHRNFALSLQGGAIGVLILTVFAAYRLYALLPAGFAFALLVVIVAGGAMLAVLQDATRARGPRDRRRLPRADPHLDRQRQSRRAVRLLRRAQCGGLRDRLDSAVARAQSDRLRVHIRHRHVLGLAVVSA